MIKHSIPANLPPLKNLFQPLLFYIYVYIHECVYVYDAGQGKFPQGGGETPSPAPREEESPLAESIERIQLTHQI